MPALAFLAEALWGILSRLVLWVIRYVAPWLIGFFATKAATGYVLFGISLTFYISSFVAVMTFVNDKASELLNSMVLDNNPYWLTGLSMLPSNILSCLTTVFLAYTIYLIFRFKIFISRLIASTMNDSGYIRNKSGFYKKK